MTTIDPLDHQHDYVLTCEVHDARRRLTDWVWGEAARTATRVGFSWIPLPDAPTTYEDLRAAYDECLRSGEPLPVSSDNSSSVIVTSTEANYAWRFVHDVAHVEQSLSFSHADEWELALWHLDQLTRDGYGPDSLEHVLLKADTLGQVVVSAVSRRFPADQALFDLDCQHYGFEHGILREIRRELS